MCVCVCVCQPTRSSVCLSQLYVKHCHKRWQRQYKTFEFIFSLNRLNFTCIQKSLCLLVIDFRLVVVFVCWSKSKQRIIKLKIISFIRSRISLILRNLLDKSKNQIYFIYSNAQYYQFVNSSLFRERKGIRRPLCNLHSRYVDWRLLKTHKND